MSFRMPAEWEPQSRIWLSWPHNIETWPDNLSAARDEFVGLATTIAATQQVIVFVGPSHFHSARSLCREQSSHLPRESISFVEIPTNDAWARDYAPTFVIDEQGEMVAVNWHYNAWGGKYPPFDDDQKVCQRLAGDMRMRCVSPGLCLEGGAIEINESGVVLSTKTCALDPNRNPDVTLGQVEELFREYLGAKVVVWLNGDAIEGDDTNGHIDQLARFTDDQTIVYAWSDDESDNQQAGLAQNLDDLKNGLHENGLDYRLVPLPIPQPIEHCGRRIPASYCNFLITNELLLVPKFGVPEDDVAIQILRPLFPNRKVVGLPSKNLSVGLGSFHCLSQQQPE